jgi:deazaflavin-dependent oxidoreductase (nitroreductase family)
VTELRHRIKDIGTRVMSWTHRVVLKLSGGRLLRRPFGMPAVELHTVGRKSGAPRSTMLASPVHDDRRVVLVASKGGDERDPDWYLNAMAHPDVEVTIDGVTRAMRARTASAAERADLWPQIVAAYKGYEGYQRKTQRSIPVVICEPLDAGGAAPGMPG